MLSSLVLALLSTMAAAADAAANDARLNDVCFVDAQHGWAVGDRGVIWHTDDGGQQWQPQESGVACPLRPSGSLNEQIGWAGGGFAHPYTHTSTGVLLTTRDGGQTWTASPETRAAGPAAAGLFRRCGTVGRSAAARPCIRPACSPPTTAAGVGGRCRAETERAAGGWLAGRLRSTRAAARWPAATDRWPSSVGGADRSSQKPTASALRSPARLRFAAAELRLAGGRRRIGANNRRLGRHVAGPAGRIAARRPGSSIFAALAVRGPKCWIAGTPGTRVFSHGRRRPHLERFAHRFDRAAAGDRVCRRPARLGRRRIGHDPGHRRRRANLAAAAGRRHAGRPAGHLRRSRRRAAGTDRTACGRRRISHRRRRAGTPRHRSCCPRRCSRWPTGCTRRWFAPADRRPTWRGSFPCARPACDCRRGRSSRRGTASTTATAWRSCKAQLVRQIRALAARGDRHLRRRRHDEDESLSGRCFRSRVAGCSPGGRSQRRWPIQTSRCGPGAVGGKAGIRGRCRPDRGAGSNWLRRSSVRGWAARWPTRRPSRADCCRTAFALAAAGRTFRLLVSDGSQESGGRDFFAGIALAPGGPARRELPQSPTEDLDALQRIARKRRHVQAILEQAHRTARRPSSCWRRSTN